MTRADRLKLDSLFVRLGREQARLMTIRHHLEAESNGTFEQFREINNVQAAEKLVEQAWQALLPIVEPASTVREALS